MIRHDFQYGTASVLDEFCPAPVFQHLTLEFRIIPKVDFEFGKGRIQTEKSLKINGLRQVSFGTPPLDGFTPRTPQMQGQAVNILTQYRADHALSIIQFQRRIDPSVTEHLHSLIFKEVCP
jgi:hypothetical protein